MDDRPRVHLRQTLATLEIDIAPFLHSFPRMSRPSSIGEGVRFLNRCCSYRLSSGQFLWMFRL